MYSYLYGLFSLRLLLLILCAALHRMHKYPMFGTFNKTHTHTHFTVQCYAYTAHFASAATQYAIFNLHRTRPDQNNTIFILIKIQLTNEKMFFLYSLACLCVCVRESMLFSRHCCSRSLHSLAIIDTLDSQLSAQKTFRFIWILLLLMLLLIIIIVIHERRVCVWVCIGLFKCQEKKKKKTFIHGILYFQYVHFAFHPSDGCRDFNETWII